IGQRFFGWVAYTLMRAERRDGPTYGWRPFDYDQTHNLTIVASANLGAGWEAGLRFRFVTGRPTTSPSPSIYNADTFAWIHVPGAYGNDRLPDFHQLDLRIEKRWRVGRGLVGAFLEVLNVYNQANIEGWEYADDGVHRAPIPSLPIVPNLGLRGEW
ncbi:MAG: energy transducer TonB, partial [Deltaproteobacteria bacterium]